MKIKRKIGFYPRLAALGIRKNKRMFIPYILTCTGMVTMFYILMFLSVCDALSLVYGAGTLRQVLALGSWVVMVFAGIFLLYTNSFLIRRRKKEFGLYNILGMDRKNIGKIQFWETLIIAGISIGGGLFAGISLSKLAELGMINVLHGQVTYGFYVPWIAVKRSVQVFGVIFALLLLNSLRQIGFSSALSLLHSESVGEKPPKGNWALSLIGALLLAGAYYLAVTIRDPLTALNGFFLAVLMVIAGTYLLLIAGSVFFCRILQKNRNYYYKPNHFVSVSSMKYRMKRNGAGLASICILATMILVIMASSTCLYFGEENSIRQRYPRDINLEFTLEESGLSDERTEELKGWIGETLASYGVEPKNLHSFRRAEITGLLTGDRVDFQADALFSGGEIGKLRIFNLIPLKDYNAMTGQLRTLSPGEAYIYTKRGDYGFPSLFFGNDYAYKIREQVRDFVEAGDSAMNIMTTVNLIVPDLAGSIAGLSSLADFSGDRMMHFGFIYDFDTGLAPERQIELYNTLCGVLSDPSAKERFGYAAVIAESQEHERTDFYGLFGSVFYLGIILSIVFVLATVLIIYYKQVSEGYEDQARFGVMQKVGMTKREIRKSVNSQLLTVFFLPLALAAMHLAFAFPIIRKLLLMFSLDNVPLFAGTTVVSLAVFSLFYMIVYRFTAGVYYNIVSGAGEDGG